MLFETLLDCKFVYLLKSIYFSVSLSLYFSFKKKPLQKILKLVSVVFVVIAVVFLAISPNVYFVVSLFISRFWFSIFVFMFLFNCIKWLSCILDMTRICFSLQKKIHSFNSTHLKTHYQYIA